MKSATRRCSGRRATPIFEAAPFGGDHEMWATAWAIGMGYDLPGAGIEAYGRPSDAQIAAAGQCR